MNKPYNPFADPPADELPAVAVPAPVNPFPTPPVQLFGAPYQPHIYPELVFKYSLLGATVRELSELLGISTDTFQDWEDRYPLFKRSLLEGRALADAEVAHSLYRSATGYEREEVKIFQFQGVPVVVPFTAYYAPDVNAAKHWLTVRQKERWRDMQQINVESKQVIENRTITADATPEQAADMYKRMLG